MTEKKEEEKDEQWRRPLGDDTPRTPLRESVPISVPKKK
jgi:hypothetical protein